MTLPHPLERLAGCCWLPRLIAKVTHGLEGKMSLSYRLSLGSPLGVDGMFLRHFGLRLEQVTEAVKSSPGPEDLERWFLSQSSGTKKRIETWNVLAPQLGAKGQPGRLIFLAVRPFFYPKCMAKPVGTIFEAIVQDEDLEEPGLQVPR